MDEKRAKERVQLGETLPGRGWWEGPQLDGLHPWPPGPQDSACDD